MDSAAERHAQIDQKQAHGPGGEQAHQGPAVKVAQQTLQRNSNAAVTRNAAGIAMIKY